MTGHTEATGTGRDALAAVIAAEVWRIHGPRPRRGVRMSRAIDHLAPWDAALEEQIAHAADQAETDRLFAEIGLAE